MDEHREGGINQALYRIEIGLQQNQRALERILIKLEEMGEVTGSWRYRIETELKSVHESVNRQRPNGGSSWDTSVIRISIQTLVIVAIAIGGILYGFFKGLPG